MQDSNGDYIYFSSIGKKFKINNAFLNDNINKKSKKKTIRNYFLNRMNNSNEIENDNDKDIFLDKDNIFDMTDQNDKNKNNNYYNLIEKNYEYNKKYKYYRNHLEKIKEKKRIESQKQLKKQYGHIYEPNLDCIKKKINVGPKWEYMTGRNILQISNNNTTNYNSEQINNNTSLNKKKIGSITKESNNTNIFDKSVKESNSFNDGDLNILKIKPNTKTNKVTLKLNKDKSIKRVTTPETLSPRTENKTIKKEKTMFNFYTKLLLPKVYKLDYMKIENKLFKNMILPFLDLSKKEKNIKKKIRTDSRDFKNRFKGLNSEQIKAINDYKKYKKLNSVKKVLKYSKTNLKRKKRLLTSNEKYNNTNYNTNDKLNKMKYIYEYDNLNFKSFNTYINKSLMKFNQSHSNIKKILKKDKSLLNQIKKNNEYYFFNCNEINNYSFKIFDNVTYKNLKK